MIKPPVLKLTLRQPNSEAARMTLEGEKITMGRSADCTLPIRDRFLSRHHAEFLFQNGAWHIHDCGSANGTFLNGTRLESIERLREGDIVMLGDSELQIGGAVESTPRFSVDDSNSGLSIAIPIKQIGDITDTHREAGAEGLRILNRLAMELIEDRPMSELFDFIVERVMHLMSPSRCALALLNPDSKSFQSVYMRCRSDSDSQDLTISRTLLEEVVVKKNVLSFNDVSQNENLAMAKSIIGQSIRSALCAPLIVGDSVLGVLYLDYLLTQRTITEPDVRLVAQISRVAAAKLETTRLREESHIKAKMEEELRTAYVIQSRLLPSRPPEVEGYRLAGVNRPVRTVSGDYYDFVVRPDGRIYFIIGDVSGKGITAALVMASLATAFGIFTKDDPTPAGLLRSINQTLAPKTAPSKFVTVFAGMLDPKTGVVNFANAGHTPPLVLRAGTVDVLDTTDMVVGLFPQAQYRDQSTRLGPGDALLMFTDGVIEAENPTGDEMGHAPVCVAAARWHAQDAATVIDRLEKFVLDFTASTPLGDDLTILALSRSSS
ncbi:MAG: SpoIIE family protein phosphatase [Thermoanaerobaculia bacterium]|nr:SpoIIE family protein phosphatase [Thermoanaerobaculia bacterium]